MEEERRNTERKARKATSKIWTYLDLPDIHPASTYLPNPSSTLLPILHILSPYTSPPYTSPPITHNAHHTVANRTSHSPPKTLSPGSAPSSSTSEDRCREFPEVEGSALKSLRCRNGSAAYQLEGGQVERCLVVWVSGEIGEASCVLESLMDMSVEPRLVTLSLPATSESPMDMPMAPSLAPLSQSTTRQFAFVHLPRVVDPPPPCSLPLSSKLTSAPSTLSAPTATPAEPSPPLRNALMETRAKFPRS